MRIVVNCFSISNKRTGIGYYAYHLLRALARSEEAEFYLIFARDAEARHDFAGDRFRIVEAPVLTRQSLKRIVWENLSLPKLLEEKKADIYFSPDYSLPNRRLPCPAVVTVPDLAFISYPRTKNRRYGAYLRLMVPAAARRAGAVIAISDYTKREVVRLLGVPGKKVTRIYCGRDESFENEGGGSRMADDLSSYILCVGTLDPRKNITGLVEAFSLLKKRGKVAHRLVLAGPRKFGYGRIRSVIDRLDVRSDVIEMGYVGRDKLHALYRGATLFILPSIYEGFGLPLLEAMACGTPVAASNVTAIPEVAGDAALYFDPLDIDGMASAMRRLIEDRELGADLVRKGYERLKFFSWEKCARETMDLFRAVVGGRGKPGSWN